MSVALLAPSSSEYAMTEIALLKMGEQFSTRLDPQSRSYVHIERQAILLSFCPS